MMAIVFIYDYFRLMSWDCDYYEIKLVQYILTFHGGATWRRYKEWAVNLSTFKFSS